MSEEKIKKMLNCQAFFLVGPDFSSSEDSSTVEYSECAPTNVALIARKIFVRMEKLYA